uniref:Uncharacterized protein n=1 Tax=Octopus bimaculoides TaxID=37653 RepID=A0A0L8ICT0_OCTBM
MKEHSPDVLAIKPLMTELGRRAAAWSNTPVQSQVEAENFICFIGVSELMFLLTSFHFMENGIGRFSSLPADPFPDSLLDENAINSESFADVEGRL